MEELTLPPEELEITPSKATNEFYVVSIKKFCLLLFASLGLYSIYWFYKNWANQKRATGIDCWPVMRGIFYIFFTHSLFRNIDKTLSSDRAHYKNDLDTTATLIVVATISARISINLSEKNIGIPITSWTYFALVAAIGYQILKAQKSINLACNDPKGKSNDDLSWLNLVWMIIGGIFTVLVFLGLFLKDI